MNYLRAAHNWGQVAGRAAFYGPIGCMASVTPGLGPLARWCMYRWCSDSCDSLRIQRTLVNGQYLTEVPQAVIVANHLSSLDILILGAYLRKDFRWLAKASLFKVPFTGWFLRAAGHIPVHRNDQSNEARDALNSHVHRVVQEGASLLFFPEGTRSETGRLKPFKLGAFVSAIREELPVLPIVIRGTHEMMKKNAADLAIDPNRACSVTCLPPISFAAAGEGDISDRAMRLRDITHQVMQAELDGQPVAVDESTAE
ncbi:MAG: lysophospholipid acyltransferase family protein [Myxococcota bacterium]|nr:lysophospholipid acyltransferase family protein [Myxococcota bacterium]